MRFTEPAAMRETLRAFMFRPQEQRTPFLFEIRVRGGADWNGRTIPAAGLIIEGARPMGCSTGEDNDPVFSLTNSDSDYRRSIGCVRLSDLLLVETLEH